MKASRNQSPCTVEVIRSGRVTVLTGETGIPLSALLSAHSHPPDLPCGGKGVCGRCAVKASGALAEPTARERERFSEGELREGMRLACQAIVLGSVQVELEEAPRLEQIQTASGREIRAVRPLYSRWGAAVDIGTTTLCAQLYGREGLAHTVTRKNPQIAFGADVVSRVGCALDGQGPALAQSVRDAVSDMILRLAELEGIGPNEVDAVVITGNTVMLYLLTGRNPEPLSHAPFAADCLFGAELPLRELLPGSGLQGIGYLPRCISAFVGADITTAAVATGLCDAEDSALLVDVGTNGEIALWREGKLLCCSTAAGPAFEGVGITHGVYGVKGAIDHVRVENGQARCSTIGGAPASGICGSGIVDALAVMLELGVIDETGAFQIDEDVYPLDHGIGVTQKDVRAVQLAKGAVRAGIETMLQHAGADCEDLDAICIAGGFGSYLRLQSAAAIGLLPREGLSRMRVAGNSALAGAAMLLQDADRISRASRLAESAKTISLDGNPAFSENYMQFMLFE